MQAYTYILYSCQITIMKISFKLKNLFFKYILLETEFGVVSIEMELFVLETDLICGIIRCQ